MSVTAPAALPPTVAELQSWSRVDFSSLDDPYTDDDLGRLITGACAYLTAITGRAMDGTMPPPLVPIAQDAIRLRVEQIGFQGETDYVETASDDLIQSFSAGGYSETRKEPGRLRYTGATTGIPAINDNSALNMDIWLLMTPDMQDYWRYIIQGTGGPALETTEADWGNYDGLYPYGYGVGAFRSGVYDASVWGA
jgi:hypothetical protein